MKGIVFTEFIEMMEKEYGLELSDRVIQGAGLSNDGAYTAVGTYDYLELLQLLGSLSELTGTPVPELVQNYGKHLFQRFQVLYPEFFEGIDSALDLLPLVESYIHVEVRKLYPDAKLPTFDCIRTDDALELTYRSERPFADLAEGLIRACAETYHDTPPSSAD